MSVTCKQKVNIIVLKLGASNSHSSQFYISTFTTLFTTTIRTVVCWHDIILCLSVINNQVRPSRLRYSRIAFRALSTVVLALFDWLCFASNRSNSVTYISLHSSNFLNPSCGKCCYIKISQSINNNIFFKFQEIMQSNETPYIDPHFAVYIFWFIL